MDLDAKTIEQLGQRVHDARTFLHVDDKSAELAALDEETAQPGFWDNVSHAQAVSKKAGNLREAIREYDEAVSLFDDAQTAYELAGEDEAFAAEASAKFGREVTFDHPRVPLEKFFAETVGEGR